MAPLSRWLKCNFACQKWHSSALDVVLLCYECLHFFIMLWKHPLDDLNLSMVYLLSQNEAEQSPFKNFCKALMVRTSLPIPLPLLHIRTGFFLCCVNTSCTVTWGILPYCLYIWKVHPQVLWVATSPISHGSLYHRSLLGLSYIKLQTSPTSLPRPPFLPYSIFPHSASIQLDKADMQGVVCG